MAVEIGNIARWNYIRQLPDASHSSRAYYLESPDLPRKDPTNPPCYPDGRLLGCARINIKLQRVCEKATDISAGRHLPDAPRAMYTQDLGSTDVSIRYPARIHQYLRVRFMRLGNAHWSLVYVN